MFCSFLWGKSWREKGIQNKMLDPWTYILFEISYFNITLSVFFGQFLQSNFMCAFKHQVLCLNFLWERIQVQVAFLSRRFTEHNDVYLRILFRTGNAIFGSKRLVFFHNFGQGGSFLSRVNNNLIRMGHIHFVLISDCFCKGPNIPKVCIFKML